MQQRLFHFSWSSCGVYSGVETKRIQINRIIISNYRMRLSMISQIIIIHWVYICLVFIVIISIINIFKVIAIRSWIQYGISCYFFLILVFSPLESSSFWTECWPIKAFEVEWVKATHSRSSIFHHLLFVLQFARDVIMLITVLREHAFPSICWVSISSWLIWLVFKYKEVSISKWLHVWDNRKVCK